MSNPNDRIQSVVETFLKKFKRDYAFGYRGTNKTSHKLLWISAIFIVIALIWSYTARLDEVTIAQGKVIPSKQIQLIQNLEGGIVKEILVRPGDMVAKNQILAYLDGTRFQSDYNTAKQKVVALRIQIERLAAETSNKPLVIPEDLQKADPALSATEMTFYQTQMDQIKSLDERKALIDKEISMTQPLINSGDVSKVDLLRLQQQKADIVSQKLTFMSTAFDQLTKARADLATLQSDMLALHDRLERTTVRSPVKGIVNQVYVTTVGGVIKPGDNLMDIVPFDDTLLIEGKVKPADIGFIHLGQAAVVKITAFDYSIYGSLKGKVENISADTVQDDVNKAENYYLVRVRTPQNYILSKDNRKLYIIPGMTASVDILTGNKSVLDYLMKPILKAKDSALRER